MLLLNLDPAAAEWPLIFNFLLGPAVLFLIAPFSMDITLRHA